MTVPHISRPELLVAFGALVAALGLQSSIWIMNGNTAYSPHTLIMLTELTFIALMSLTIFRPSLLTTAPYRIVSFILLGLISVENVSSIATILHLLVTNSGLVGYRLLGTAIAIFLTNIIVFALWYWEIDSPGFSGKRWSRYDKDFLFPQQIHSHILQSWRPQFLDYLYISVTNAINFAPADTVPMTRQAKLLMSAQALISVTTLALIIARSVSIIGQ